MSIVGDTNVRVQVNGTTFCGMYETVGSMVELVSADFGDHSIEGGRHHPLVVAQRLLRMIAEQAVSGGSLFLRDDGTLAVPGEPPGL